METKVNVTIIVLLVTVAESFGQYNQHLTGPFILNDSLAVNITADSTNSSDIIISHGDTVYAYATIDSSNNSFIAYKPCSIKPKCSSLYEKGYGNVTDNYDIIYAYYKVEHSPDGTVVFGPKEDIYTRAPAAVNNLNNNIQANLWPNPVSSTLHFIVSDNEPVANIKVFNLNGMCVYTNTLNELVHNEQYSISTQSLPQGLYFLQISGENYLSNTKFVKQ